MSPGGFDTRFDDLPAVLPIFPLQGALLLPGGSLPLNIFEPRYLAMVQDSLGGDRLIGMIQPSGQGGDMGAARVYNTGCAGRITSFKETDDGRILISLSGLIRFTVASELPLNKGYRWVVPDFECYRADLDEEAAPAERAGFLDILSAYMKGMGIKGSWSAIEDSKTAELVTNLAMNGPFGPVEKQALLEAMTLRDRIETLTALMTMAVYEKRDSATFQ